MASTLVFIDRAQTENNIKSTISELAGKVRNVKPHLALETVEQEARSLQERNLFSTAS
jgi:hypothetical protein